MIQILIIAIIIAILYNFRHVKIKFSTFFRKGFAPKRGKFGIYCYCGKQGSGKTYSAVEFLINNKDKRIYSNVHLDNIPYTYFNGFDELLDLRSEHDCIIVFDEIFTALTKTSKINTAVLDFLSQMRKRQIVFITTAQEWLEISMTLRRYCRFQIDCSMRNIGGIGILIKRMYDAEQMKWSQEDNEYVAPIIETTISKCNLRVANCYDTFEQIQSKQ